jgi:hypothetical protein
VQVYVDDIVLGGSSNYLVARFADDVRREFEMSMMGELKFYLGIQIKQSKKEHLCTKLSTPRTLCGSSRWRIPRLWRRR